MFVFAYVWIFFGLFSSGKSWWQSRGNIRRKRPRKRCCAWRSWSRREKIRNPNGSSLTIKPIPRIKKDRCVWEKLKSFFVFNPAIMLKLSDYLLQVKRSIFASPESVNGKVGVGTCGIADKPMTQYNDTSKYNVRHLMPQWSPLCSVCSHL